MLIEEPRTRHRKSYKDQLDQRQSDYESTLNTLGNGLQRQIKSYYDILSGQHTYTDTHSGKTVHARTYKKRMEFAQKQLERLQIAVGLEKRYGRINQEQEISILEHAQSLYNVAIRDNAYLKDKKIRSSAAARHLRSSLSRLESTVADAPIQKMAVNTGYNFPDVEISMNKTSSPIYNKLREIERSRPLFWDANDAKLPDNAPTVWPYSRSELQKAQRRKKRRQFIKRFRNVFVSLGTAAAIAAGALVYNYQKQPLQSQNIESIPIIQKEDIQYSPDSNHIPLLQTIPGNRVPQKIQIPAYEKPVENSIYLEEAKARAQAAIRAIELEKQQAIQQRQYPQSNLEQKAQLQDTQSDSETKTQASLPSLRESILRIWEKRSKQRALALNLPVVKTVTYYPDGNMITDFPNPEYNSIRLASSN